MESILVFHFRCIRVSFYEVDNIHPSVGDNSSKYTMATATLMFFIAGLSEGMMDWLQFKMPYDISRDDLRNSQYWNPLLSWKNKWHDGDPKNGEAFWQSSRLLVFLTDGWHMTKFIRNIFIFASVLVVATCDPTIAQALIGVALCRLMYGVGFAVTYNWIHKI